MQKLMGFSGFDTTKVTCVNLFVTYKIKGPPVSRPRAILGDRA